MGRVERDWSGTNVIEGVEYDIIGRRHDGSRDNVETNLPGRDEGPGGHLGEQETMCDVEVDWKRQSISDGV